MSPLHPDEIAGNNPFWEFCKTVYARPGVEQVLLELQDEDGADVLMVLYCCWTASEGRGGSVELQSAFQISQAFQSDITAMVRLARRALKGLPDAAYLDPELTNQTADLRAELKSVELGLEALQTRAMAALLAGAKSPASAKSEPARQRLTDYFDLAGLKRTSAADERLRTLIELMPTRPI